MIDLLAVQENTSIQGVGALGKLLAAEPDRVVYEQEGVDARVVELRRGDTAESQAQLRRWQQLARLSHQNLLCVYEAGHSELSDVPVIYAVMDRADESLADVLSQRTLTEQEAKEVLQPSLSALSYLHSQGYALGSLDPSSMLAAGDCLKLSTASVMRVEDGGRPEEDVHNLGVLLVRALTGAEPELNASGEPFILQSVSEPLRGLVQHLLESNSRERWTAEQALSYLWRGVEPVSRQTQPQIRREVPAEVPHEKSASRMWIYIAAAAALVLLAVFLWPRSKGPEAQVSRPATELQPVEPSQSTAATPTAPAAQTPPAPQAAKVEVPAAAPEPPPEKPAEAPRVSRPSPSRHAEGWVVVVAAYAARGPAEKRAKALAKKWSKFNPEVFEAPSEKVPMLVVIGRNLSQKEADALRQRAVSAGLPRDTYIKRIAEQNG